MTTQNNRIPSAMSFFTFALTVLSLAYIYVAWRLAAPFGAGKLTMSASFLAAIVCLALPIVTLFLHRHEISPYWKPVLSWASYLTMGVVSILFVLFIARDILLILYGTFLFFKDVASNISASQAILSGVRGPWSLGHLSYLSNIAVVACAAVFTLWGLYGASKTPGVVEVTVPIHNLPPELANLKMVQLTDLHAGPTIGRRFLGRVVGRVNELNPDIVFVTGDLVDGGVGELREKIAPIKSIRARYGIFYVTGNHEYYSGVLPWIDEVKRLGMKPLINEYEAVTVGGATCVIAGVTDYNGGAFIPGHLSDPVKAIEGAPKADVTILLAHQPRSIFKAAEAGYDLQISGHTHGGQYFPWNNFIRMQQPYSHGLHLYGSTWIYVSRGTGYWGPPLRIGEPSEITVFRLVPAEKK